MHLAPLIFDLAVILGVAAIVTFVFRLIKQPVVLGYIVAGIIVGPYTPDVISVVDVEGVKIWAELGVIFLMFSLGLEFSFRRLAKVGVSAGATAVIQILTMIFLGYLAARLLGWATMDATFLGCMIAISSTTIIIKALEELGLKTRRFAELVFGILIVEDLAAIIMLVALTDVATKASVSGVDLLIAGGKLALVVGAWVIVGMFLVPRFVKAVGQKGSDEMLLVVSLGLCLVFVALSAQFHYSVALGAFIMGSILAETREVHRIEHLVAPLKDMFGAIFFVSVGMLLDPTIIGDNLGAVLLICVVIALGKMLSVAFGALVTGQSLRTAVFAGASMAQIGEFSFIIATLGLTLEVISPKLYPIIVAASLITTFTTPYFIKGAAPALALLERRLPRRAMGTILRYEAWFQKRAATQRLGKEFYQALLRWLANLVVVVVTFVLSAAYFAPWIGERFELVGLANLVAWALTFLAALPFIYGMLVAWRGQPVNWLATVLVVGLASSEFYSRSITTVLTAGCALVVIILFRRRIEHYYRWFEDSFISGIGAGEEKVDADPGATLVPWNAHLVKTEVPPDSELVGKTLAELKLRERYQMNVVVIERGTRSIVAPKATERIYPGDTLRCFGTDEDVERFVRELDAARTTHDEGKFPSYELRPFELGAQSPLVGSSIRASGIRERYDGMVVGLERDGRRIQSPESTETLKQGDVLWIVGEQASLAGLAQLV